MEAPRNLSHRSVSQFSTFAKCGEQYRLQKVEQAPQTPAAWLAQGTAFHTAIEAWERAGRALSGADVHALFEQAWQADIAALLEKAPLERWLTGGRAKPETDLETRHKRGHDQVEAYMTRAATAPERPLDLGDDEYAVELPFTLNLGGVEVIGAIDQVVEYPDGGLRVRDLKTGNKKPDWDFQLAVYRLALEKCYGIETVWGDFYMAKTNDATLPVDLSRYPEKLIGQWFRNADRAISMGLFVPNPGDGCRVCSVYEYCEAIGGRSDEYPYREMRESETV